MTVTFKSSIAILLILISVTALMGQNQIDHEILQLPKDKMMQKLKKAIRKGTDINTPMRRGRPPLVVAARNGNLIAVKALLSLGAKIDIKDSHGATPLIAASNEHNYQVIRYLIKKGAAINAQNNTDHGPLIAIQTIEDRGDKRTAAAITALMLKTGADVNIKAKNGNTALLKACESNFIRSVRLLLKAGADLNSTDEYSWDPLISACSAKYPTKELVQLLIEHGADITHKRKDGKTALEIIRNDKNRDRYNYRAIIDIFNRAQKIKEARITAQQSTSLLDKPGNHGKIIIRIPHKAVVTVIDKHGPWDTISNRKGRWIKAAYENKTGWIFSLKVNFIVPLEKKKKEKNPDRYFCWVQGLRIRSTPGFSGKIIGKLNEGDRIFYLFQRSELTSKVKLRGKFYYEPWIKIKSPHGKTGWVFGGAIKRGLVVAKNGTGHFTSLQKAITGSEEGETIFLKKGNYSEVVTIYDRNNLSIMGQKGAWIKTGDESAVIIEISQSKNISLDSLSAVHTLFGKNPVTRGKQSSGCERNANVIDIEDSKGIRISNCNLMGSGYWGIYAKNTDDVTIRNNIISECTAGGFRADGCYNFVLTKNIIADNVFSFIIKNSKKMILNYNTISKNNLSFTGHRNYSAYDSNIEDYITEKHHGYIIGSRYISLSHNIIALNSSALKFVNSSKILQSNNYLNDPHYVDIMKNDFRLRSDSPARQFGKGKTIVGARGIYHKKMPVYYRIPDKNICLGTTSKGCGQCCEGYSIMPIGFSKDDKFAYIYTDGEAPAGPLGFSLVITDLKRNRNIWEGGVVLGMEDTWDCIWHNDKCTEGNINDTLAFKRMMAKNNILQSNRINIQKISLKKNTNLIRAYKLVEDEYEKYKEFGNPYPINEIHLKRNRRWKIIFKNTTVTRDDEMKSVRSYSLIKSFKNPYTGTIGLILFDGATNDYPKIKILGIKGLK